ncbi:hypothetical protein Q7P35_006526 [Cladosporium inversicolor]
MHLTTIVSLVAVGAAAAPAPKSWDLNNKIAMPTPSASDEILPALPPLDLRRRQESEKDPLDAYLETLDGDYDEQKSEEALDHDDHSLDEDESTVTTSTTVAAQTPAPDAVNSIVPVEAEKKSTVPVETKNSTIPVEAKNETSSAVPESTENDSLSAYLETLNGDYDEEKSDSALGHYHDSLGKNTATTTTVVAAAETPLADALNSTTPVDTKNETSSAAPEPTKKAASKDPLTRLNSALPLKRQEFPEKPDSPSVKRQLDGLLGSVPDVKKEDVATPEVSEEDVAATTTDAQNATSAAGNTTAETSTTASSGYKGITKHMAKLDKLPLGGLPVKRGIPTKINNEEVKAPEVKPEDIRTPTTGEEHIDAHPVSWEGLEDATTARTSRPSTAGQKGYKNMSKLDWLGLPFKRQLEEETIATPEVMSSDPAVEEKPLASNTTLNETSSIVSDTGADTGSAAMAGVHEVSKHASKLPVNLPVGLPAKRQAPEFLSAPIDEPVHETASSGHASPETDSPLHKYLVPLKK